MIRAMDPDEMCSRDLQLAMELQEMENSHGSLPAPCCEHREHQQHSVNFHQPTINHHSMNYLEQDGFFSADQMKGAADNMPYVLCQLDGKHIEMLVDSGASCSAISSVMVEKLGLQHKLTPQVGGRVSGIGSAPLVGIVENVACSMGAIDFRLFFLVVKSDMPFAIMGLDQMRRFQCVIDLGDDSLRFGGFHGVRVPFLTNGNQVQTKSLPPPTVSQLSSCASSQSSTLATHPPRSPVGTSEAIPLSFTSASSTQHSLPRLPRCKSRRAGPRWVQRMESNDSMEAVGPTYAVEMRDDPK